MRPMLVAAFALACSPDGPSLEPWHGEDDGTPYLGPSLGDRFPHVTRTYDDPGAARLLHDGPELVPRDEVWLWPNDLTVVEAADDLRIAWEGSGVQLLLWLPRADMVDAVAYTTTAVGRPDALPDTPGLGQVQVPAGTEVVLDRIEGDHVFVEWEAWSPHSTALVSAWVHLGDVDQAWLPAPSHSGRTGHDAWIEGAILDAPLGEVLAISATDDPLVVDRQGDAVDGWWPVAWSNGSTRVEGWVHVDDLTPIDGYDGGWGVGCSSCCGGVGFFSTVRDRVPIDTPIRVERDGPIVGRTTRPMAVPGFSEGGGWLPVDTPWGTAELWADRDDLRFAELQAATTF